ncbi:MAG: hypothetical protein JWO32_362 [Bacteroidetes bacterium]|nr:hypothetical protein [Bacteroidota bacterium]
MLLLCNRKMFSNNYKKIVGGFSLFVFVIGITISKKELCNSGTISITNNFLNASSKVGSNSENNDVDENASRVYFSIFKFISNLVPSGTSI